MARPLSQRRRRKLIHNALTNRAANADPDELNLDGFEGIALCPDPHQSLAGEPSLAMQASQPEPSDRAESEERNPPAMQLASLMEIQDKPPVSNNNMDFEPSMNTATTYIQKPRMLGDSACELGIRYFDELIAHRVIPRGRVSATNITNLEIARNALKTGRQSVTFSHGAVAQRIGDQTVCIFEPLENKISAISQAIEDYSAVIENKITFFILNNTENVEHDKLTHISMISSRFKIPQTNIFILQDDMSFVNYVEDVNGFVPSRIDVSRMTGEFFSSLLDYVHDAYDEGDTDTVMRVLGPLMGGLFSRVQQDRRFSRLLAAQAFNLMGMTNRALDYNEQAIRCFEASLAMLRVIEAYDAIKSVQANLGISYAIIRPATPQLLEQAVRHLNEVTQLNPYDDESWIYLGNSYLEQFRMCQQKTSLLHHALRAYERAEALAPSDEISACVQTLRNKLGINRRPVVVSSQAQKSPNLIMHA